ncbi:MAG: HAD-IIB family hydrolase [Candidatus Paceibacterota bacterium]|jgi:hypothetical protein
MAEKKLYIFDLDNTLTESRTPVDPDMARSICDLLDTAAVAVISGAAFWQFEYQLLGGVKCVDRFSRLFILPTSGAELFRYDTSWKRIYSHRIPDDLRARAISVIVEHAGVPRDRASEFIEDRGSGITYSALGIKAPPEQKSFWDPDQEKRRAIVSRIAPLLPELSARIGGTTSIDLTLRGIDKAFGVEQLLAHLGIDRSEAVFVGDALFPGGNDDAIRRLGMDEIKTSGPAETRGIISSFLKR